MGIILSAFDNRTFSAFGVYIPNTAGKEEYQEFYRRNENIELAKTFYVVTRVFGLIMPKDVTAAIGTAMTMFGLGGRLTPKDACDEIYNALFERIAWRGLATLFLPKESILLMDCSLIIARINEELIKRELEIDTEYDFFPI